jgi:branched-chain amino acid transport system ATP-binding protein
MSDRTVESLLSLDSVVTGYGKKQVLKGISISVSQSEVVALIGHNGAGKSTVLKTIFGLIPIWHGKMFLNGEHLPSPNPHKLLMSGVSYVPQGNCVFTQLSVRENLEMGGIILKNKIYLNERIDYTLKLFPVLARRLNQRAGSLSGGEKQMLALAIALILTPHLLLLDEPSLGLAPALVAEAFKRIKLLNQDAGVTIIIVEQKVREVLRIADRIYVLRNGIISFSGPADELKDDLKLRAAYL